MSLGLGIESGRGCRAYGYIPPFCAPLEGTSSETAMGSTRCGTASSVKTWGLIKGIGRDENRTSIFRTLDISLTQNLRKTNTPVRCGLG
jgi:hypothetical protein